MAVLVQRTTHLNSARRGGGGRDERADTQVLESMVIQTVSLQSLIQRLQTPNRRLHSFVSGQQKGNSENVFYEA